MSGTRLRDRAKLKTALTGDEIDVALTGRGTAWRRELIAYAAFAALACSIAIASLVAAPRISGLLGGALGVLMLAIAVADARAFIIPDKLTIAAFGLALANAAYEGLDSVPENIAVAALRGVALAAAFFALREIYLRLRRRHGIGLGDVKLAAVAGAWLDWTLIPVAIEIAALAALIFYLASQLVLRRPIRATAKLP
ncbi:MAG: prepilin peptidase, partial [Methylocella sp.]